MTQQFAGIQIMRQTAGLYFIEGKSVSIAAEGENNDQLKVRVGSSWFAFADYMAQVKSKKEREGEEDDPAPGDVEVQASLESPSAENAAAA